MIFFFSAGDQSQTEKEIQIILNSVITKNNCLFVAVDSQLMSKRKMISVSTAELYN